MVAVVAAARAELPAAQPQRVLAVSMAAAAAAAL